MKYLSRFPLAVIVLGFLAFAAYSQQPQQIAEEAPTAEADVRVLKMHFDRYCATVMAGDLDAYRTFWTDDVVWLPPGEPLIEGIEACMDHHRPFFEQYNLVEKMSVEEIKVGDPFTYVRVNYTFLATPKAGGEPIVEDGKGMFIMQRKPDGSWVSTHCVWNSNIPLDPQTTR